MVIIFSAPFPLELVSIVMAWNGCKLELQVKYTHHFFSHNFETDLARDHTQALNTDL